MPRNYPSVWPAQHVGHTECLKTKNRAYYTERVWVGGWAKTNRSSKRAAKTCVCVCVPRNPFESAPTARFNNPKVLPLLQTMSSIVQPCRWGCPAGTRLHIDRCRQRTTAPALRTIRTTTRHTLHARVPYRSPHPSPMHPLRLKGRGGYTRPMVAVKSNLDVM